MDIVAWFQTLSAVLVGNALFLGFGYALWTITKVEKTGQSADKAPGWTFAVILAIGGIAFAGFLTINY